jgi:hypothetical protein
VDALSDVETVVVEATTLADTEADTLAFTLSDVTVD